MAVSVSLYLVLSLEPSHLADYGGTACSRLAFWPILAFTDVTIY